MRRSSAPSALVAFGLFLAVGLGPVAPAAADHMPNTLRVTVTDSPDPGVSQGEIEYTGAVKNDGRQRSLNVRLETTLPLGTSFVSCRTSVGAVPCQVAGDLVTATFPRVSAHATVKMFLTVRAPAVTTPTVIQLDLDATGDNAHKGDGSQSTTVFPPVTGATLLPSGRGATIACGGTINSAYMGGDTTVVLTQGLTCTNTGHAIRITASGVTLDLGGKKIVHTTPRHAGDVGVVVGAGATNVTIRGAGTQGTKGIEQFDICVKDEGDNAGLLVSALRCFRARSAGIDISSTGVTVSQSLIDNTIPAAGSTGDPDGGGVGIRARGDNILIKDTIVRRSDRIGIWAHGADTDGNGRVVTVDGNTTTSKVENSAQVGILLELGPHQVKTTRVQADGPNGPSGDGIVVGATATGALLNGAVVKRHGGNGVRVEGAGTRIDNGSVEEVGGVGYLIMASAIVAGTQVHLADGDAYRVEATAAGTLLDSNTVEDSPGNGFVVHAAATLEGNSAKEVGGWGFIIAGDGSQLESNEVEVAGAGVRVTGNNNSFEGMTVVETAGIGFEILGTGNVLDTCEAEDNTGVEFAIGPNNEDGGSNSANGDSFTFTAAGGTFD